MLLTTSSILYYNGDIMNLEFMMQTLENVAEELCNIDKDKNLNLRIMRIIRSTLWELGMERSYADQMVASMDLNLTATLNEEQIVRLETIAIHMVTGFYKMFRSENYNDQAIALMGKNFMLTLTD